MKTFVILAFFVAAAVAVPNGYGAAPVRVSSGYSAPLEIRESHVVNSGYDAPLLRTAHHVPILKYLKNDDNYGNYNVEIQTGDGISQVETGSLKHGGPEGPVNVKEGSYSWTSPEGQHFQVSYVADEFGYRASGVHLPTPPPIPAEIARSLALPRVSELSYGGIHSGPAVRLESYAPTHTLIRSSGY